MQITILLCSLRLLVAPLVPAGAHETTCPPPERDRFLDDDTQSAQDSCTIGSVAGIDPGLWVGGHQLDDNPPPARAPMSLLR